MKTTTRRIFAAVGGLALRARRALVCLVSFALVAGWVGQSWASPLQTTITYDTSMTIGTQGVTGTPVVGFQGITGGTVTSPTPTPLGQFSDPVPVGYGSNVPLGSFTLTAPPSGTSTTYKDTPFLMTFKVDSVGGDVTTAQPQSFTVQGALSGTIDGYGHSDLRAGFSAAGMGPPFMPDFGAGGFAAGGLTFELTTPNFAPSLAGGVTPISGVLVSSESVPEPGSLWVFLAVSAGPLAWRRLRRKT